jgi:hypothetical protein
MTGGGHVRALIAKETRALLPIWLVTILLGLLAPFMSGVTRKLIVPAFGAGIIALGAYSIGHEYVNRTLGVILTLPAERRRILLVKLGVLSALVLPLAGYASLLHLFAQSPAVPPWLVAGVALGLAPLLTMVCRNPLAGGMFSVSIATQLLIVVLIMFVGRLDAPDDVERAAFVTWWRIMVVVVAGGAVLGWWQFKRLQWIEGGVEITLPSWFAASPNTAPGRPFWLLVKKELHLQRVAFALTAMYVVAALADAALRLARPHDLPLLKTATVGYWLCLPVLMGSVASADERQLGTLSWQLLLPAPAWRQWAAKTGSVFGLALLLGIAVPVLMLNLPGAGDQLGPAWSSVGEATVQALALAAVGLYASSLVSSGVIAVGISFAAITAGLLLTETFAPAVARAFFRPPFGTVHHADLALAVLVGVSMLLVAFAFANHCSEEKGVARLRRQVMGLTALVALAIVLVEIYGL